MGKEADFEHSRKPHGVGTGIHELVRDDLYNRALFGAQKYGELLKAYNGRDGLEDAYEEILDLAVYLKQEIKERQRFLMEKYRTDTGSLVTVLTLANQGRTVVYMSDETQEVLTCSKQAFEAVFWPVPKDE